MDKHVFLIELIFFGVIVIGWAIWEYRKISKLHEKTLRDDAKDEKETPPN